MPDGFHPPLEQYLEAIHSLGEEAVPAIQARLVERVGHSPQTVSEMIHRLRDEGYLRVSGRGLELTDKGRALAENVVRKHRLAERFLVDIVGLPWPDAHYEADRWEHVLSDDVAARFDEILGHPSTCPHGNPIPGRTVDPAPQYAMSGIEEGARIQLARITEQVEVDHQALVYLSEHGLVPGRKARVRSRAPDGTLTLELDDDSDEAHTVAIGPQMGHQLFVTAV